MSESYIISGRNINEEDKKRYGLTEEDNNKISGFGSKVYKMNEYIPKEAFTNLRDYESDSSSETSCSSTSSFDEEFINETVDKIVNKKVYVVWDKINKLNMAIFDSENEADEYCNKLNKKILDMISKKIREKRFLSFEPLTNSERKELYSLVDPWNKEETDEDKLNLFSSQLGCLVDNDKYEIKYVVLEYPLNRKGLENSIFKGVHLLA